MTRLERVIKAFNDYDNFVKDNTLIGFLQYGKTKFNTAQEQDKEINRIRNEVSILIGELRRHGCRREN